MRVQKTILALLLTLMATQLPLTAQELVTLDSCRARALRANAGLKQAEMKVVETEALEHAALWQMLPKVSANGGYLWMEKSVNLLSEEQKERLAHLGDNVSANVSQSLHEQLDPLAGFGPTVADALSNALSGSQLTSDINSVGQQLVTDLETDTRRMGGGMVTLTQPVYMGGKLLAMHRTAMLTHRLAGVELSQKQQETLLAVDEAYWQVVSVGYKKALAEQYAALLDTLEHHVELLLEAEMATKGDLAQVRVKHNEAEMQLTKARNGQRLAKMLLAERCGMPLEADFEVGSGEWVVGSGEWGVDSSRQMLPTTHYPLSTIYSRRNELQMLRIADSVAQQGVRVAASVLKPNVVVTGGYLMTNPNVFDGFKNEWGGTWTAGVVVNVPLVHPAGIYALRAAKAKRQEVAYQMEEAERLIALQVSKLQCELELAYKHLAEAESNLESAEDNLELAQESFGAGACSSSDLMAAQTGWMKAESEVIDARIEIEMGRVYLKQAMGIGL
ncbi:MAG: TolC family protein [Bacteroidales bacterium]|nr:TolC family protein [Bacteroidales bacterium]